VRLVTAQYKGGQPQPDEHGWTRGPWVRAREGGLAIVCLWAGSERFAASHPRLQETDP
jgi:hypothetical protein